MADDVGDQLWWKLRAGHDEAQGKRGTGWAGLGSGAGSSVLVPHGEIWVRTEMDDHRSLDHSDRVYEKSVL